MLPKCKRNWKCTSTNMDIFPKAFRNTKPNISMNGFTWHKLLQKISVNIFVGHPVLQWKQLPRASLLWNLKIKTKKIWNRPRVGNFFGYIFILALIQGKNPIHSLVICFQGQSEDIPRFRARTLFTHLLYLFSGPKWRYTERLFLKSALKIIHTRPVSDFCST